MFSTLISFLLALFATAVFTPIVRRVAVAVGAVDQPTARRVHTRKIPRLGGIAIVAGFFFSLIGVFALNTSLARQFFGNVHMVAGMTVGACAVAALGAVDDLVGLGAKRKLLVQVLAASAAYAGGLRIDGINLPLVGQVQLGWLGLPATVLWIVAVVNALNLIDGLDGLAAGVAFFACVTNFVAAYLNHNMFACFVSATMAGAIIGFLIYNFNPATIFMGDSGSMFLGYTIATTSLVGSASQKAPTVIAILVPLLALGLPIMDMLFAIMARFLERRPIFSPDRGHIHHRLLDLGLTHRRAVLTLYGLSLAFTLVSLALAAGRSWQLGLALAVLTASLIVIVRFVGYFRDIVQRNTQLRRRDPMVDVLRRAVPPVLPRIEAARSIDDLPELLERFAADSKLLAIEVTSDETSRLRNWRWEIPATGDRQIRDAVQAKYNVTDSNDGKTELTFYWDAAEGFAGPECVVLLQLVVDAAESLLKRPARARVASRTGKLRPI